MNIQSDPVVNFYDPVITCSFCSGKGHSKLSCHFAKAKTTADISYDDIMFWSYVHPDERPECLREMEDEEEDSETSSDSEEEDSDTSSDSD